jgi:hypothetical protein
MSSYGTNDKDGWRKASSCASGECVEVAKQDGAILMRDSKDPSAGTLTYTVDEFRAFVQGIRAGEFDDLCAL